jgi:copper oxidase (laccase) domain-containing protein
MTITMSMAVDLPAGIAITRQIIQTQTNKWQKMVNNWQWHTLKKVVEGYNNDSLTAKASWTNLPRFFNVATFSDCISVIIYPVDMLVILCISFNDFAVS